MRRDIFIFAGVLLCSLCMQAFVWSQAELIDEPHWAAAIQETSEQFLIHPTPKDLAYGSSGYPAMPLVLGGGLLAKFGVASSLALRFVLILLTSCGIALATTLAYLLRPQSMWLVTVAAVLLCSTHYYEATPPSSIILPYIVSLALLTLYVLERGERVSTKMLILFGAVGGFALSIRLDISSAVLFFSALLLVWQLKQKTFVVAVTAGVTFFVCDPYLWFEPVTHLTFIIGQIFYSYTALHGGNANFAGVLLGSPLTVISVCFALLFIFYRPLPQPFSQKYLLWLAGITILIVGGLLISPVGFHPQWYFFPIFLIWETFLPLFVLTLITSTSLTGPLARFTHRTVEICVVVIFALIQTIPFATFLIK